MYCSVGSEKIYKWRRRTWPKMSYLQTCWSHAARRGPPHHGGHGCDCGDYGTLVDLPLNQCCHYCDHWWPSHCPANKHSLVTCCWISYITPHVSASGKGKY